MSRDNTSGRIRGRVPMVFSAAVCSLILASSSVIIIPQNAYAVTSAEKQQEADALMSQLDALQTEINAATDRYNNAIAAHDAAVNAMNDAQAQIDAANATITDTQGKLSTRAVEMYKNGQTSYVEVLLGTTEFSDFVSTWDFLNDLNDYDAGLVQQNKDARAQAEAAYAEYSSQEQIAANELTESENAKADLDNKAAEMQTQIDQITAEVAELQAQEEAAAHAAAAAAAAAQAAQAAQNGTATAGAAVVVSDGYFTNPVPGYNYISSGFGWRSFDNAFHKGIDMAASAGTPIYAAAAGTVLVAGYNYSAGNWVIISHGDGFVTKYMHMIQTPFVSAGQYVEKGQNIGLVGSTGDSTGPHCHFQIELNGTAVNPLDYLSL